MVRINRSFVCTAALLCASVLVARADEVAPTPPASLSASEIAAFDAARAAFLSLPPLPKPLINQPLTFNSPTISLVTTPSTSKADVATFLQTPVSFKVKDASFLSAFDAVLSATGKACPIECRNIKPMKVTFGAKNDNVGVVLDTLAKMGGASLWLLPDKLLLCHAASLSVKEKEKAKPWSVLISKTTFPAAKLLAGKTDFVAMLNTKISASLDGGDFGDGVWACQLALAHLALNTPGLSWRCNPNEERIQAGLSSNMSFSFEDVTVGEAMATVGHMDGYELYLLPDHLLLSPPGSLTPEQQKVAIPAFTYPGFGKPALSAPNS